MQMQMWVWMQMWMWMWMWMRCVCGGGRGRAGCRGSGAPIGRDRLEGLLPWEVGGAVDGGGAAADQGLDAWGEPAHVRRCEQHSMGRRGGEQPHVEQVGVEERAW
jgi:hypothetical protein